MSIRKIAINLILAATASTVSAVAVDWDKIEFWTGSGSNRAALVVQFNDGGPRCAYVWGYRWNDEDFADASGPSGEDMFRAIAGNSSDLLLFTQYTGWMGCTVDGIGFFDPDGGHLADKIAFDFAGASSDTYVSFDYFNPNELMGQTSAPGNFTQIYCNQAIEESKTSNIINHPINALNYGYPAYDYDWWQPVESLNTLTQRWNAGWYNGYWSYWTGGTNLADASYSGVGYSSRKLTDGQVDGWKYTHLSGPINGNIDGDVGSAEDWYELNYNHVNEETSIENVESDCAESDYAVYSLSGAKIEQSQISYPGIYVVRFANGQTRKIIVK